MVKNPKESMFTPMKTYVRLLQLCTRTIFWPCLNIATGCPLTCDRSLLLMTSSKLVADAESIIAVCSLPLKHTFRDLAAYTEFWMNSKYFSKAAAAARQ